MSVRYGFDGQVAVITGAANGFGLAVATRLAGEGARLVLVDRDAAALEAAASQVSGLAVVADVSVESDVDGYVSAAVAEFGRIDLFFNNAGIEGRMAPMTGLSVADFDRVWAVNGRGVMARDLTAQIDPADPEGAFRAVSSTVPLYQRYGTATEVANVVAWLLSSESEYVSGALHLIDGALNAG
jgi:NAD(P)-dependent dehydrogenase (short-subunit alcohol dehydrogenase family)